MTHYVFPMGTRAVAILPVHRLLFIQLLGLRNSLDANQPSWYFARGNFLFISVFVYLVLPVALYIFSTLKLQRLR